MKPTTDIIINQMGFKVVPCEFKGDDFWAKVNAKQWEPESFQFMQNFIRPDKSFIDIGGWIGVSSLQAYAYNPRQIYTIEADPANYQAIKQNVIQNNLQDKIKTFNVCLTDFKNAGKIIQFGTANEEKPNSSSHRIDNGSRIFVKTTDAYSFLNRNCDLNNVNCMNIDIEGAEKYLCETLSRLPGKKSIMMSFHPPFWTKDKELIIKDIMKSIEKYAIIDPFKYSQIHKKDLQNRLSTESPCKQRPELQGEFFSVILLKNAGR